VSRPTNYDESPRNWIRVYVDLKAETSDALNVEAATLRISKKALIQNILESHFAKGGKSGKGK
jgi:hypothetical protein